MKVIQCPTCGAELGVSTLDKSAHLEHHADGSHTYSHALGLT